ncbi:MAG TPA: hypothetical protein DCR43_03660 [Bacteroidales bacterium]|nr:MAG: hypothetical protein A2X11_00355 [Bacteroidetes bacterium GWE2_42_24]OFY27747.1 MAG: hypothetical protein A2X09_02545 [Bacteroidetes bacterium GWF2_43_11]HAQ64940.1 hypothetical protein [Bacteroidales bacterium]HBZ66105.1 hypothetical protein [Bacteroidales bacterium]
MQNRKIISDASGLPHNEQVKQDEAGRRLDAMIAGWALPVEVPDDPLFSERVLSMIKHHHTPPFSRTKTISAFAAAAVLAVAVGIGLGNLVDYRKNSPVPENELMFVANDLGIGMTQIDPFEYLLSDEEE